MRYILGPSSGGRGARGNRTPAGSALFSVTPTFLPRSARRLRHLRRRHCRLREERPHPFPVGRKRSPAWRFLQCTGCWPVKVPHRLRTHCCSKEDALIIKSNSGRSNRTRRKAPFLVHLVPRSGKRGISFCQRARPALGIKFFLIRKSPAIRSSNLISGR